MQLRLLFLSFEKNLRRFSNFSFTLLMSDLGIPRTFFWNTLNARHNKLSIDFAWSGSIFQIKSTKLTVDWKQDSDNL